MRLTTSQVAQTARWIEKRQRSDGAIPWYDGGHLDPWNHVEAAMGLDVAGLHRAARAAYKWCARSQRGDGSWFAYYRPDGSVDPTLDANFSAYVSVGTLHHFLSGHDEVFLASMFPVIERAVTFVLDLQSPSGEILWARDASYVPASRGLVTSSACIHLSLICALALADRMGEQRPDWELALQSLGDSLRTGSGRFEDKSRFSMDWYYPVLGGVLVGEAGADRIRSGWDTFVIEGRGCRCVSDRPWITAGESAELVLALSAAGDVDMAERAFGWLQYLRTEEGAYWTGATYPDETVWPRERTTWNAGAVLLADALLKGDPATTTVFGGELFAVDHVSEIVPDAL